jgi:hypothetical protein
MPLFSNAISLIFNFNTCRVPIPFYALWLFCYYRGNETFLSLYTDNINLIILHVLLLNL